MPVGAADLFIVVRKRNCNRNGPPITLSTKESMRMSIQKLNPAGFKKLKRATVLRWIALTAVVCVAFATVLPAFAKEADSQPKKSGVTVELTQHKVIKGADGKEQLVDAATVKPGDVIEYQAVYVNHSAGTITGLVGELPIPEGLEYVRKSAKAGAVAVRAATKEGVFASEPLMRKVGAVQQEVPVSEYRKLRWTLGQLVAEGKATVSARALVQTYVTPSVNELASAAQAPPVSVSVMRAASAAKP